MVLPRQLVRQKEESDFAKKGFCAYLSVKCRQRAGLSETRCSLRCPIRDASEYALNSESLEAPAKFASRSFCVFFSCTVGGQVP